MTPLRRRLRPEARTRAVMWGAAGIVLLVSATCTLVPAGNRRHPGPRVALAPSRMPLPLPDPDETSVQDQPDFDAWPPFRSARTDEGWSFDLFTAPNLYTGRPGGGWSVTPPEESEAPAAEPGDPGAAAPVPLRVVEIVQDLFPVQLAGFGRSPRGRFGLFHLVASGEVVVAREGERLGRFPWRVTSLSQGRKRAAPDSLARNPPESPHATVLDEQTGEHTQLVAGERLNRGEPWAWLEIAGRDEAHAMQAGERVTTPAGDFVLTSIEIETRRVVVTPVHRETTHGTDPLEFVSKLRYRAADTENARAPRPQADAESGSVQRETTSTSLR